MIDVKLPSDIIGTVWTRTDDFFEMTLIIEQYLEDVELYLVFFHEHYYDGDHVYSNGYLLDSQQLKYILNHYILQGVSNYQIEKTEFLNSLELTTMKLGEHYLEKYCVHKKDPTVLYKIIGMEVEYGESNISSKNDRVKIHAIDDGNHTYVIDAEVFFEQFMVTKNISYRNELL